MEVGQVDSPLYQQQNTFVVAHNDVRLGQRENGTVTLSLQYARKLWYSKACGTANYVTGNYADVIHYDFRNFRGLKKIKK